MDVEFMRYRFEDGSDELAVKNRFKIGVRHLQVLYMFLCSMVFGVMRGSNGVAILAITDTSRDNDTHIQVHHWDRRIQGATQASFFFGYAVMLLPTELLLSQLAGKLVITVALVINGVLCAAMPYIVNRGGWIAVSNAQFLMGLLQAWLAPANRLLLENWLPPNEKKLLSSLVYGGTLLGTIISLPIAGLLTETRLGWELIFYSQAMMLLSMGVLWGLLTSASPNSHQAIGDTEKEYIEEAMKTRRKKKTNVPWRLILGTRAFWAIVAAHAATNAIFVFYLVDVPVYLQTFGSSIKTISLQAMLPFVFMWFTYLTTAPTIDWIYRIGFMSYLLNTTYYRKLINALGAFGAVIGFTILSNLGADSSTWAVAVLTTTLSVTGFQYSGFLENNKDISRNFSGSILTLSRGIASFAGAVVPVATGCILNNHAQADMFLWRIVFLTLASFCVACNVCYSFLGSGERARWDQDGKNMFGYHNDTNQLELEEMSLSKPTQKHIDTSM